MATFFLPERAENVFLYVWLEEWLAPMKLFILPILFLAFAQYLTVAHAKAPGLRVAIFSKGLDYVQNIGVSLLESELSSTAISDLSDKVKLDYGIGRITLHWTISKLHIDSLSIPISSLTPSQSTGLTFKALGISVTVKGHIHTRTKKSLIRASTDMTWSLSGVSVSVGVLVGRDHNGRPNIATTQCSASVSSVHHKFHGDSKWVYKTVDHIMDFDKKFSKQFQPLFCKGVQNAINKHGSHMLFIPLTVTVNKYIQVNYALTDEPTYSNHYIATDYSGEFQLISDPEDPPFSPPPLPSLGNGINEQMISIWISDYVANTAGLVYHKAGILNYNITPDAISKHSPLKLILSLFLPLLYKAYPNMGLMLNVKTTKPPHFEINSKTVSLLVASEVNVFIEPQTVFPHSVLTLALTGTLNYGELWIEHRGKKFYMCANATSIDFQFSVVSSNIIIRILSKVMTTLGVVTTLGEPILMEFINFHGRRGFQIPMPDGIELIKPKVTLGDGYLKIATDLKYNM